MHGQCRDVRPVSILREYVRRLCFYRYLVRKDRAGHPVAENLAVSTSEAKIRVLLSWVPYRDMDTFMIDNATTAFNPETNTGILKKALPPAASDLPLQYSKMFSRTTTQNSSSSELEFMRNKHVTILGSSLDREAVRMFCRRHEGSSGMNEVHHRYIWCNFPSYNFTLSYWHHFGLHQSNWYKGDDTVQAGITIEQRLDRVFLPLANQLGKPSLLIFTSGLWGRQQIALYELRDC